jgi:hypothetical protein
MRCRLKISQAQINTFSMLSLNMNNKIAGVDILIDLLLIVNLLHSVSSLTHKRGNLLQWEQPRLLLQPVSQ